ncbi:phospholipase/carboxylesterase [Nitzschia inconspicua]|uniref:Phospholipase/carboxylesterase n=1 Tax=Nitzschia inconspicua TaxID=303405 RepID=A0A9K3L925_9STRA|nr:phospholipase/carboxylesterase [Nitzschia inconspicua]
MFAFVLILKAIKFVEMLELAASAGKETCVGRRAALVATRHLFLTSPLLLLPRTSWGSTGFSPTASMDIPAAANVDRRYHLDGMESNSPKLQIVADPKTYSSLAFAPPNNNGKTPLILVLHGAGRNDQDIRQDLADPYGEHAGLIPSLIESGNAPHNLLQNFAVLAPYSYGKSSFYSDSRTKLLDFCDWAVQNQNTETLPIQFDPNRIILFGFSDGATVAVELLTTRRFAAGVICSYGYSGKTLPAAALDRLSNLPIWVFHSQDDVIFDVQNSDRLVHQLETVNEKQGRSDMVRYSKYTKDPENLPPRVRGHSMGITASKMPELYDWMLHVSKLPFQSQLTEANPS